MVDDEPPDPDRPTSDQPDPPPAPAVEAGDTDLGNADLRGADLGVADLRDADLDDADLGAELDDDLDLGGVVEPWELDEPPEVAVISMDLRDVEATVEYRAADGERELVLVLFDGYTRVELTGGLAGRRGPAIWGAQRIASASLDYASGMALFSLAEPSGD